MPRKTRITRRLTRMNKDQRTSTATDEDVARQTKSGRHNMPRLTFDCAASKTWILTRTRMLDTGQAIAKIAGQRPSPLHSGHAAAPTSGPAAARHRVPHSVERPLRSQPGTPRRLRSHGRRRWWRHRRGQAWLSTPHDGGRRVAAACREAARAASTTWEWHSESRVGGCAERTSPVLVEILLFRLSSVRRGCARAQPAAGRHAGRCVRDRRWAHARRRTPER